MSQSTQNFCDGLARIYAVENAGSPGDAPRARLKLKTELRYEERTVGVTRHYEAMRAGDRVDMVIRCQRVPVSALDVAIPNDGMQYRITLVQHPRGVEPPCMDLTLQRLERNYEAS